MTAAVARAYPWVHREQMRLSRSLPHRLLHYGSQSEWEMNRVQWQDSEIWIFFFATLFFLPPPLHLASCLFLSPDQDRSLGEECHQYKWEADGTWGRDRGELISEFKPGSIPVHLNVSQWAKSWKPGQFWLWSCAKINEQGIMWLATSAALTMYSGYVHIAGKSDPNPVFFQQVIQICCIT